jgi:hypothetical protein
MDILVSNIKSLDEVIQGKLKTLVTKNDLYELEKDIAERRRLEGDLFKLNKPNTPKMDVDPVTAPSSRENKTKFDDGFTAPKNTNKRLRLGDSDRETLVTNNRFDRLDQEDINENPPPTPKKVRIPPIFLRSKEKWSKIPNALKAKNLNFTKAVNTSDSIKILPTTTDDYRGIVKFFDEERLPFHTFQLQDDKPLKVVIRGICESQNEDDIKSSLLEQGFSVSKVSRMRKGADRKPLPLVLIELSKEQKAIFDITRVCNLSVKIESYRRKDMVSQCHRCQEFGHSQNCCRAVARCVKCAGRHLTAECNKKQGTPAKCCHCGESHTASYRGCAAYQKFLESRTRRRSVAQNNTQTNKDCSQTTRKSYAAATASSSTSSKSTSSSSSQKPKSYASATASKPTQNSNSQFNFNFPDLFTLFSKLDFNKLKIVLGKITSELSTISDPINIITVLMKHGAELMSIFFQQ